MTFHSQPQIFGGPIAGGGTTGPITLAVATTGNDADATRPKLIGSGDWSAKPFATIQAAIDALPKTIKHATVINVGAGAFAGFSVKSFGFEEDASIVGTRELFTPATGPSSGQGTYSGGGGDSGKVLMTGAGWTPNDLVGKFLVVTAGSGAGYVVPIWKNTTDTIFVSYNLWFDATSEFRIEDLATRITSMGPDFSACYFQGNDVPDFLTVENLKVTDLPGSYPFAFYDWEAQSGVYFLTCCAQRGTGALYGGFAFSGGRSAFCEVIDGDASGYGIGFYTTDAATGYYSGMLALRCVTGFAAYGGGVISIEVFYGIDCGEGLHVEDVKHFDSGSWGLILQGCDLGVSVINSLFSFAHVGISDCTVKTFDLSFATLIRRAGWFYGTGNAGYGLNLQGVGNVFLDAATYGAVTIAGASGELMVDGVTPVAWVDLWTPGGYYVDPISGARAVRKPYA
jgi:hypothetical protein